MCLKGILVVFNLRNPIVKLIVFADYGLGEIDDDYRFDLSKFNK